MMENLKARMTRNRPRHLWSLFIYLKYAFDTVNHEILFKKLRKKNVAEELVNTIEWIYD